VCQLVERVNDDAGTFSGCCDWLADEAWNEDSDCIVELKVQTDCRCKAEDGFGGIGEISNDGLCKRGNRSGVDTNADG
jgi:hypothetical protein